MQIIINRATANKIVRQYADSIEIIAASLDDTSSAAKNAKEFASADLTNDRHANWSVKDGENLTLEINDEVFFKYFKMYSKLTAMVMPFIGVIKTVFKVFKSDMKEIEEFVLEQKPSETKAARWVVLSYEDFRNPIISKLLTSIKHYGENEFSDFTDEEKVFIYENSAFFKTKEEAENHANALPVRSFGAGGTNGFMVFQLTGDLKLSANE